MKAIILVGGLGTRLRTVASDVPKPMVLINNKPFLEILLDYLIDQGFKQVILAVGYLQEQIINYFKDHYKGLHITYSIEPTPLGTGGAILQAMNFIAPNEDVFIINGDTYCRVNYSDLHRFYLDNNSQFTIVIKHFSHATRYGTVVVNSQNKIIEFSNIQKHNSLISCGIYLINKQIFQNFDFPKCFSFENDFLIPTINKLDVLAYKSDGFFIDIGIPEDYYIFKEKIANEK